MVKETPKENGQPSDKTAAPETEIETDNALTVGFKGGLLYGVDDKPPFVVAIPFAFQLCTNAITFAITFSLLISKAMCASDLDTAKIISTSIFIAGFTTLVQTAIGVRLPIYQGPSILYVMPIVARAALPDWKCMPEIEGNTTSPLNYTDDSGVVHEYIGWDYRMQEVSGSLMAVSVIHAVLGFTGVVGLISRFIGPLTIVPTLTLLGLDVIIVLRDFAEIHWGIAATSFTVVLVCSCYLANVGAPVPLWNRNQGWYIAKLRFFRPFGIIFAMVVGWVLCVILTEAGALSDNPEDLEYKARTDNKGDVIDMAKWFYFPYPGQFGAPRFSAGLFFGLIIAMITSILDSVADYMITSKVCQVAKPPPFAVNRGLFLEGVCSILSGAFGAGLATTSYSGVIGSLSLTGIASRRVFYILGLILMLLGIFGKVAAFFVTIPKPVVGGFALVGISSLIGMALSGLDDVDMGLPRNVMALGLPLVLGTVIPSWVKNHPRDLETGITELDQLINALMSNPMFVGGILGFFLDNTLPGKPKVKKPTNTEDIDEVNAKADGGFSVYSLPYVSSYLDTKSWTRFIPILPTSPKHEKSAPI